MDRHPQLPGPAARHAVLGVVPDRAGLGGRGDRAAFLLALGLALLLNQELRLRWLARALAIIPWAMPEVVVGIMWRLVYNPDAGVLNETLRDLGLGDGRDWLSGLGTALPAVIVVGVWAGMPQTTVALLEGLQNTPHELHEAAAIDGAGAWRRFRTVTWPALRPVAPAVTALNLIWNFNWFLRGIPWIQPSGGGIASRGAPRRGAVPVGGAGRRLGA